ncbi:uncharacterized protein [Dermacentor albipictus]|uniref:uncharacterized protein isoform X2 n=1 Tax=Dermacentor albipictus TaxID=60249 RepID=UPI0031FC73A7
MSQASNPIYDRPSVTGPTRVSAESQENMEEDLQDTTEAAPEQQLVRGGPAAAGSHQALDSSTPSTQSSEVSNNGGTDTDWEIAMSKRQKRRQRSDNKQQVLAGTSGNENSPGAAKVTHGASTAPEKKREGGGAPRRRLPPLPRDDLKIVLRPRGLAVKSLQTHQVAQAVVAATKQGCKAEDLIIRLRNGSNIIISSTDNEEAAQTIRRITQLSFGGKNYAVNAHVAAPEGTLRGVIHGVDQGTSPEELKTNLRVRTQGVKVLAARMLGRSSTAVITFDGPILPKQVLYYGGEMWCYPYRPTRQVCYACGQQGHRMDVCPNPETRTCRQCGCQNPEEVHQCTPKCLLCGGDHAVGTRDCKQRLKSASELRWGTQQQLRRSRSRSRGRRPRWFRDESQGPGRSGSRSRSRGRSRSRSRSRSRGSVRDESYPPLGNTDKKQLQQKQQQKKSGEGVKCLVATWYLACNFQFFIISIFILIPLYNWPIVGLSATFLLLLAGSIVSGVITFMADLPPGLIFYPDLDTVSNLVTYVYHKPYNHIGPYCVGVFLGYVIVRHRDIKLKPLTQVIGWCTSFSVGVAVLWAAYRWNAELPSPPVAALYAATHRVAWCIALAWLTFACVAGHGGFLDSLLSWPPFNALGNLAFMAYLMHPLVILYHSSRTRDLIYYSQYEKVYAFCGHFLVTLVLSTFFYVVVEMPFTRLGAMLLRTAVFRKPSRRSGAAGGGGTESGAGVRRRPASTIVADITRGMAPLAFIKARAHGTARRSGSAQAAELSADGGRPTNGRFRKTGDSSHL